MHCLAQSTLIVAKCNSKPDLPWEALFQFAPVFFVGEMLKTWIYFSICLGVWFYSWPTLQNLKLSLNPPFTTQNQTQTGLSRNVSWIDLPCIDSGVYYHPTVKNIYLARTKNALICPSCSVLHQGYIQVRLAPESKETQGNIHLIVRAQSEYRDVYINIKKKKKSQ